ncbi:hypothetical protein C1Y40_00735 [Mycobacterium talmoniae]|uniref:Mammalian cell entry protein n=1 Tax=Mycobacterium talmoniae TaxID=1858794 RepID=A0A2S8BQW5_9MYCO|nr:hypothetical protein C1Y40_00735 [Mycobacterium talmoniae]
MAVDEPPAEDDRDPEHTPETPGTESVQQTETAPAARRVDWSRLVDYGVLPGLALVLALAAGLLKGLDSSARDAADTRVESVQVARDAATAMLSYQPDTVDQDLGAAGDRLTGGFRDSFARFTRDVIIPRAKQQRVSAKAQVSAAGSVSATADRAVVVLFVDQIVTVGEAAPTKTPSRYRVTLDQVGGRWLISAFDPI